MTSDEEFIRSIEISTSHPIGVRTRFDKWRLALQEITGIDQKEPRCFSYKLKEELYNNDATCAICNQRIHDIDDTAIDHIEQYWQGGRTIPENARLTHRYCNVARSRNEKAETAKPMRKKFLKSLRLNIGNKNTDSENVKVEIAGQIFAAPSVSRLYYDVLKFLCDTNQITKMTIPFETSSKRYLIAKEPHHQGGNEFKVPIEYKGYYMEAHKDYKNALNHLGDFLRENRIAYSVIDR
jgi:hypothetical protein